jgi:flagellar basal-body rod protein FlgB
MKLYDPIVGSMEKGLNARNLRHTVVSSNLANADTPGFVGKQVDFEGALEEHAKASYQRATLRTTSENHIGFGGVRFNEDLARVSDSEADPQNVSRDGNTVSREVEISSMAENQVLYRATAKVVTKKFALVQYAISEGGK